MKYSTEQLAIFNAIENDGDNYLIEAVAGSGKSTTMVHAVQRISPMAPDNDNFFGAMTTHNPLYLAFGVDTVNDIMKKMKVNCEVSTIHSHGYRFCRQWLGTKFIEKYKVDRIMDEFGVPNPFKIKDQDQRDIAKALRYKLSAMVSISKACFATMPDDLSNAIDTYAHYGINGVEEHLTLVRNILYQCDQQNNTVDYDDMVWLPVILGAGMPKDNSIVFVDEAQDLTFTQAVYVKLMNLRTIAVGDRHQSIYGFRYADPVSMDRMKAMFNAKELPLSMTFRCPTSVVKLAQEYVPQITARPGAPEGIVFYEGMDFLKSHCKKAHDGNAEPIMIVCRYNAPLVDLAMDLISNGTAAKIRGREIGIDIANHACKWFVGDRSPHAALQMMKNHTIIELAKPGTRERKQKLMDRYAVVRIFAERGEYKYAREIPTAIRNLFVSEAHNRVNLTTIHRAKGDEADFVAIIEDTSHKPKRELQDWEYQQEDNCKYVAITRSKHTLAFIQPDTDPEQFD